MCTLKLRRLKDRQAVDLLLDRCPRQLTNNTKAHLIKNN